MDTRLLLYPTTKAWASLKFKFYTTITLNIQFLNVFTEPAMHYRGAFHLCLKQNPKKEKRRGGGGVKKVIGFRCFSYNAGYLSLHNPQTCRAPAAPTEHGADAAPTQPGGGWGLSEAVKLVCACSEEEWPTGTWKTSGGRRQSQQGCFFFFFWFMSVHVSL